MEAVRFDELQLDERIVRAVTDMGFEAASPIQGQAIPLELQGLDIIGQAQTGTGKTAAFGIPLLQKIDPKNKKPQAIILCPTRELAIQVSEEIRRLAKYMHGVKVLPIYGGQEIGKQIRSLKGGVQIIVGTPGREMDQLRRKTNRCANLQNVLRLFHNQQHLQKTLRLFPDDGYPFFQRPFFQFCQKRRIFRAQGIDIGDDSFICNHSSSSSVSSPARIFSISLGLIDVFSTYFPGWNWRYYSNRRDDPSSSKRDL